MYKDITPCISPLPHDGPLQEKPTLGLIQEETEAQGVSSILGKFYSRTFLHFCLYITADDYVAIYISVLSLMSYSQMWLRGQS